VSVSVASSESAGATASGKATEKSIGPSMVLISRCFAVRGVSAPGRRQIVLPARDRPDGELEFSVRGSTGPGRRELPLAFAAGALLAGG
jgi:hypothetical protein